MSAVDESETSEVGGLQGTLQNHGSSLGVAIIGSVMIASLTSGFVESVNSNPNISANVKTQITNNSNAGIPIASADQVQAYAVKAGLSQSEADDVASEYESSQISSLKSSMFFLSTLALLMLALSRNIPDKKLA